MFDHRHNVCKQGENKIKVDEPTQWMEYQRGRNESID